MRGRLRGCENGVECEAVLYYDGNLMEKIEILRLYDIFSKDFDIDKENKIWSAKSLEFRNFWDNRVLNDNVKELDQNEIDEIVRMLDRNASGNKPENPAVAKAMIRQDRWRKMFSDIKKDAKIRDLLNKIFNEHEEEKLIELFDDLDKANTGKANALTGWAGNAINALVFVYTPTKYISVISLNERRNIIDYFKFENGPNFDSDSWGRQIVLSNKSIINGFKALGITSDPRIISWFLYLNAKPYWKPDVESKVMISRTETVSVTIPQSETVQHVSEKEKRESIKVQSKLCEIGERLGFKLWVPASDKRRILELWKPKDNSLLNELPIAFNDEPTLKTIENIDVIWIKGRSIIRAFEVEDTTSIYSGILRMADLIALQPNLNIKISIVAPEERRESVFNQITRPVFSLIGEGERSLSKVCSYISYQSVFELANEKLEYMTAEVVEKNYCEYYKGENSSI
jgi:hypothetical protein